METVYKVVRKQDGRLLSAWVNTPETEVEYQVGVETKPKAGNLFAFQNLSDAMVFSDAIIDMAHEYILND